MAGSDLLSVRQVTKRFGGVTALSGCSFDLEANTICGLIGPNGSGKTTLFNLITGLFPPDHGEIRLKGRLISGLKPYHIAGHGIGRTFQITRVFRKMTVWENMVVALGGKGGDNEARVRQLLELVGLEAFGDEYAENLSYGQQKLLEFARLLMADPELILLDEPFAGVNPVMQNKLVQHIRELWGQGKAFLIIDHEMSIIMDICHRILVLDHGELIAAGKPEEIERDERVLQAYFGR